MLHIHNKLNDVSLLVTNISELLQPSAETLAAREQRRQQRLQENRKAHVQATAAAKAQLDTIKSSSSKRACSSERYGDVQLPPNVLQKVMGYLSVIEADGVRGPSMAAHDLANAALVSSGRTFHQITLRYMLVSLCAGWLGNHHWWSLECGTSLWLPPHAEVRL
jgi:hypothetical protein